MEYHKDSINSDTRISCYLPIRNTGDRKSITIRELPEGNKSYQHICLMQPELHELEIYLSLFFLSFRALPQS